jgi:hypothetical protein
MPSFDRLWIDCIQEEARIESRNKQRGNDDENQALAAHTRKGKGKGSTRREGSPEQWKNKDLSKVKCFACHKQGHYAYVHYERKGSNRHQQQRWMRLQTSFKGSSYWSLPCLVQFSVVGLGWWIVELLVI